jgi:uncharacterized repeat protein (TIGR03843 family)
VPADELTQPAGDHVDPLVILQRGTIEIVGRMPWSSNATFLANVVDGDDVARAIYKPARGERPLWDFPTGLFKREVGAYVLSATTGLDVIPPTVLRSEGPLGVGSLQWFVEADFAQHYFTLYEQREDLHDQMRAMAVFDIVANNTDRKSGHCLIGADDRLWGIDNGLCFAAEFKLRTVIWEFGGEPIAEELLDSISPLRDELPLALAALLDADEIEALQARVDELVTHGAFPIDGTGRRYPWPLV